MALCKIQTIQARKQTKQNKQSKQTNKQIVRLLEFTIDYQNHLGRINVVSWGFLNMAGSSCFFACCSILVNAWSQVARHTLTSKKTKWVLKFLRINVYIFIPAVVLYLISSLLRWGLPQVFPAIVPPIFAGLLLIFALVVAISFIALGGRLLHLISGAITKDHAIVFRVGALFLHSSASQILISTTYFFLLFLLSLSLLPDYGHHHDECALPPDLHHCCRGTVLLRNFLDGGDLHIKYGPLGLDRPL